MIKIGTCGFTLKHFKHFNVIEIQETFYNFVSEEKIRKWRDLSIKNNVELTIKANQIITHPYNKNTYKRLKNLIGNPDNYGLFKPTKEVEKALEIVINEARELGSKIIIFQSPPSFKPTPENIINLKNFLSILDKNYIYGWEPRGEWYLNSNILTEIFEEFNLIHIVDPFRHFPLSSINTRYYRLHGIGKGEVNYKYKYKDADLEKLKEYIEQNDKNMKNVYVLFNNVYSFDDAIRFKSIMSMKS
ncbi:MAG: DUF72 domain-containing protein [Saccharolobus sp.]